MDPVGTPSPHHAVISGAVSTVHAGSLSEPGLSVPSLGRGSLTYKTDDMRSYLSYIFL